MEDSGKAGEGGKKALPGRKTAKKAGKRARKAGKMAKKGRKIAKKAAKTAKKAKKAPKSDTKSRETPSQTAARLSEAFGVSITRQQAYRWRTRGLPVDDVAALRRALEMQKRVPAALMEAKQERKGEEEELSLREQLLLAQIKKTEAEAAIKGLQHEEELKRLVPARDVQEQGMQIGALVKSFYLAVPETWPPMLEGMTAAKMQARMRQEVRQDLENIDRVLAEILSG